MIRSALSRKGQAFPAFPIGGPVREIEVGPTWIDLLGESTIDLVMIRVPAGAEALVLFSTSDRVAGTEATATQCAQAWPLDPGVWELCTDRDLEGPKFYIAIDSRMAGEPTTIHIMEAAQ